MCTSYFPPSVWCRAVLLGPRYMGLPSFDSGNSDLTVTATECRGSTCTHLFVGGVWCVSGAPYDPPLGAGPEIFEQCWVHCTMCRWQPRQPHAAISEYLDCFKCLQRMGQCSFLRTQVDPGSKPTIKVVQPASPHGPHAPSRSYLTFLVFRAGESPHIVSSATIGGAKAVPDGSDAFIADMHFVLCCFVRASQSNGALGLIANLTCLTA